MSFSHECKLETLKTPLDNDCCSLAFLCGILHACGELQISNKHFVASLTTDIVEVFDFCNNILQTLYGDSLSLEITNDYAINKKTYYEITFPEDKSEEILLDCGILERGEDGTPTITREIPQYILMSECCRKAFVKGAFVGCATSNIKISQVATEKTSSGYHLEFTSHSISFLNSLTTLLNEYELNPKISERKNVYVLYLKEASQISDVLALVDAYNGVMALQNEIIAREMRNKINRETNCISSNIAKTVEASLRQLEAIKFIQQKIGLEKLSPDLEEVALLRLANQEESLEDLLKLSTIKLTKSGLNHRFRKILTIAKKLKDEGN